MRFLRTKGEVSVSGIRLGVWGNCVINTWQDAAGHQGLTELEAKLRETHVRFPNGVSLIV